MTFPNQSSSTVDLIYSTSDTIVDNNDTIVDLEKKIVLSIAIRLKAEQYMIDKINNLVFLNAITKNQTSTLYKKYLELFQNDDEEIKLLNQVNLMTPENIHVNSFMYEPILDMDSVHLKQLYSQIKRLKAN